jgi:hypothetical protein
MKNNKNIKTRQNAVMSNYNRHLFNKRQAKMLKNQISYISTISNTELYKNSSVRKPLDAYNFSVGLLHKVGIIILVSNRIRLIYLGVSGNRKFSTYLSGKRGDNFSVGVNLVGPRGPRYNAITLILP